MKKSKKKEERFRASTMISSGRLRREDEALWNRFWVGVDRASQKVDALKRLRRVAINLKTGEKLEVRRDAPHPRDFVAKNRAVFVAAVNQIESEEFQRNTAAYAGPVQEAPKAPPVARRFVEFIKRTVRRMFSSNAPSDASTSS